jgi:hypothetical protein
MLYEVGEKKTNKTAVGVSGSAFELIAVVYRVDPLASAPEIHDLFVPPAVSGHGREPESRGRFE